MTKHLLLAAIAISTLAASAEARDGRGITLRQPYNAKKTPVVLVHGLWDTEKTWNKMLAQLEADPAISKKYQFATFGYDSWNPFWDGTKELHKSLDQFKREHPKSKKFILVGHSMGALMSHQALTDYGGKHRTDVQRAILIAGPHRGSPWGELALTPAVAALSSAHKAYEYLSKAPIIGVPFNLINAKYDELVPSSSSHIEGAESEKIVNTMHAAHWTDQGIAEVKRILKAA
jgi:triacylglycerol esterase/lipase EstA (alpha/beta hydrolase family)